MSVSQPVQARGLLTSVAATTATGAGTVFGVPPTEKVAMQVTHGSTAATPTQVKMEGSLDGVNWFDIGAAQSYATAATSVYVSTGSFIATNIRANVTAHTSTGTVLVSLVAV